MSSSTEIANPLAKKDNQHAGVLALDIVIDFNSVLDASGVRTIIIGNALWPVGGGVNACCTAGEPPPADVKNQQMM